MPPLLPRALPACLGFLVSFGAVGAPSDKAYPYDCQLKNTVPSITTTGSASAEVVPNVATISFAVETERPTAAEAANENARAAQAILAEIKAQGIDARDIRTSSVALDPVYDEERDDNGRVTKRRPRGYGARNAISVRFRQIDKAGALAALLIQKGANNVGAVAFDYEQKEVKYDALRVEAMRDALRKANSYVNALGLRLGRVLVIAPPAPFAVAYAAPMALARSAQRDAPVPAPVEPGVQTLKTEVEVTWELAQ